MEIVKEGMKNRGKGDENGGWIGKCGNSWESQVQYVIRPWGMTLTLPSHMVSG